MDGREEDVRVHCGDSMAGGGMGGDRDGCNGQVSGGSGRKNGKKQKKARRERDKWRIAVLLRSLDERQTIKGFPRLGCVQGATTTHAPSTPTPVQGSSLGGRGSEGKGRWLVCGFANVNNVPGTEVGFHAEVPQTDQG